MNDVAIVDPLIDEETLYEEVDGRRITKDVISVFEIEIANILAARLRPWGWDQNFGRAVMEMLFELPGLNRKRRPDVAFVSFARWPKGKRFPSTDAWAVAPDLAVEVVSRSNTFDHILEKIAEYFDCGVSLVWVIVPSRQQVYVYTSPTTNRILTTANELTGDPVIPGFKMPVSDLFPVGVESESERNGAPA